MKQILGKIIRKIQANYGQRQSIPDVAPAVWRNVPKAEERSDEAGMLS